MQEATVDRCWGERQKGHLEVTSEVEKVRTAGRVGWEGRGGRTHRNPGVFEDLRGCDALHGVDGQHFVDEILSLWSNSVPFWGRKLTAQDRERKKERERKRGKENQRERKRGIKREKVQYISHV